MCFEVYLSLPLKYLKNWFCLILHKTTIFPKNLATQWENLGDPLLGRDPPVGNHWSMGLTQIFFGPNFYIIFWTNFFLFGLTFFQHKFFSVGKSAYGSVCRSVCGSVCRSDCVSVGKSVCWSCFSCFLFWSFFLIESDLCKKKSNPGLYPEYLG